jgi:molecular chaperone HtpG
LARAKADVDTTSMPFQSLTSKKRHHQAVFGMVDAKHRKAQHSLPGTSLDSVAERHAKSALRYEAFRGINLAQIKCDVAEILAGIGRKGFFRDYTLHDISHCNAMLDSLDWLIPDQTKEIMTPGDWLMLVLAIYLHDLGMAVTEDEYQNKDIAHFESFKQTELFSGEKSEDYKQRTLKLSPEELDRYFYEEFVRFNHAERISYWIKGDVPALHGGSADIVKKLSGMLAAAGPVLVKDLALICKSHHANDLDELDKYKVRRAYGKTEQEGANVQYVAILLRIADLLHMSNDRTPSVMFRILNSSDPVSQREWAKQLSIARVCGALITNSDDPSVPKAPNAVEVHATYFEPEPFFALSAHLDYVEGELKRCAEWSRVGNRSGAQHCFPWERVERRHIETDGFFNKQFTFQLNQEKILKLLTGHTLYNDAGVVVRELVQNSIDAIQYQQLIVDKNASPRDGLVQVRYDTKERILSVIDNGCGMDQNVIEKFLLSVGSSRYSEEKFKKDHPEFAAISRFGIGILSSFMIADQIDIYTCEALGSEGRHIALRSLLGQYLIKILDKNVAPELSGLLPHGTHIQLTLRPSALLPSIERVLRHWVAIPAFNVTLQIDDGEPCSVGFESAEVMLRQVLAKYSIEGAVTVARSNGFEVAFATSWNKYFEVNEVLTAKKGDSGRVEPLWNELGTFIHGIRVESGVPAYGAEAPILVVNATGPRAPRTNVARSGVEHGHDTEILHRAVFKALASHIGQETTRLRVQLKSSPTKAVQEANFTRMRVVKGLLPEARDLLLAELAEIPMYVIEADEKREILTGAAVVEAGDFWTFESPFLMSAERFLMELRTKTSLGELLATVSESRAVLPNRRFIPAVDLLYRDKWNFLRTWSAKSVAINEADNMLSILWSSDTDGSDTIDLADRMPFPYSRWLDNDLRILIVKRKEDGGWPSNVIIRSWRANLIDAESKLGKRCLELRDRSIQSKPDNSVAEDCRILSTLFSYRLVKSFTKKSGDEISRLAELFPERSIDRARAKLWLEDLVDQEYFDPSSWHREAREM